MKAIWTGWSKHNNYDVMRTNVYKVPAHRRTILLSHGGYEEFTERFFLSLPCLYFVILKHQTPAYLYVFTGSPDWHSPDDPLYQFPWPNRVGLGSICLGRNPCQADANTIKLFFESPFTDDLASTLTFKLGKKQHQASFFKHWHALTKQYPTIGEGFCTQNGLDFDYTLNLCDAPKFSFGQTVKLARSKFIGKVLRIYSDETGIHYLVKPWFPMLTRLKNGWFRPTSALATNSDIPEENLVSP